MLLENIASPTDVKRLSLQEKECLASEIRNLLIKKLSKRGGHWGPNLGMVEMTIALHHVFELPQDKMVFDVSHQSYTHKMLTGRAKAFLEATHYGDVTGYSDPGESKHDHFTIGHTSTSISLACGLAKGRDLLKEKGNVIAIIGDGSLSGGEALEGLDFGSELKSNFIVIINDNQMSIAENHGGLYPHLAELRDSKGKCSNNIFKALGYDYIYVDEGHNIDTLIKVFESVKDRSLPIVIHIKTEKGKGFAPAEQNKETWHWHGPANLEDLDNTCENKTEDYQTLTANFLLEQMAMDPSVIAIAAGVPGAMGFTEEKRQQAGEQYVDVGIAEEHAIAMASGIAKAGGKAVFATYSTFFQRAYDQISQDLCINNNPATLLVFWGSLATMNDVTHLCHFDIPLLSNIPNLVYLAPTNKDEYLAMLSWSLEYREHPVAIRVPVLPLKSAERTIQTDYSRLDTFEMVHQGKSVAIIGVGNYFPLAEECAARLQESGIDATIINPRFISGIDKQMLSQLEHDHQLVVTLEDGALAGGFGEKVARFYGSSNVKVLCKGTRKEFVDHYKLDELLYENRLIPQQIVEDIVNCINSVEKS